MTLIEFEQKYNKIIDWKLAEYKKDKQLSKLMTNMEGQFYIQLINDNKWNEENKDIINLYRKISDSRSFI